MRARRIYSEFYGDIRWVRNRLKEQLLRFPPDIRMRAEHFLTRRLRILPDGENGGDGFDPLLGKPVPYATFWFADALHPRTEKKKSDASRKLALGLLYISLYTTITDDILDERGSDRTTDRTLANFYFAEYISVFLDLFPIRDTFWRYLREGRLEAARYESWRSGHDNSNSDGDRDSRGWYSAPFSEDFLRESSRYFVAVVLPTLAAVAILAGREGAIPGIRRFLENFSMGWRVFDDLSDWEKDLPMKDQNRSSVLGYVSRKNGRRTARREVVLNSFLDPTFVKKAYGAMLGFLDAAAEDAMVFHSSYLREFMEQQLEFHERRRDEILRSGSILRSRLNRTILRSIP